MLSFVFPGVLGMQNVLNGVSMTVGVMEKALYSSYTRSVSERRDIALPVSSENGWRDAHI
jgi:hypothetical protein